MGLLRALQLLTILPLPLRPPSDPRDLGRCSGYFPLAGLLLGLGLALADMLGQELLPRLLVGPVVVVLWAVLTGALHMDGLADAADGLLSPGKSEAERLAILHDSTVGAFGVVAVASLLMLKAFALASIPPPAHGWALVAAATYSRWAMLGTLALFPAPHAGLGQAFRAGAGWPQVAVGSLIGLLVAIALAWYAGTPPLSRPLGAVGAPLSFALAALAMGVGWSLAMLALKRIGGLTGDVHGAVCECSEALCLVVVAAASWR